MATNRWRIVMWSVIVGLPLLAAAAMLFTDAVAWTRWDFAAAALLLGGAGLLIELVQAIVRRPRLRLVASAAVAALVAAIWAHGAVGIV